VLGPTAARPVRMARARRDLQVCELAGFGSGNTGDDLAGRSVMLPEGMLTMSSEAFCGVTHAELDDLHGPLCCGQLDDAHAESAICVPC
jgi:hypothetical protein